MKRIIGMVLTVSIIVSTCIVFGFSTFADNGVASEPSDFLYDSIDGYVSGSEYWGKSGVYISKYIGGYLKVSIPEKIDGYTVKKIGSSAFSGCAAVTDVTIPDSVTKISSSAFQGCKALENINIPKYVKEIERQAFSDCSSLKSVSISDSVTEIGEYTFSGCSSLKEITIPGSITSIRSGVFQNCSALESVTISNGITSIDSNAFGGCTSLKKILIPDSVKYIKGGSEFYSGDMILENIKYFEGNSECSGYYGYGYHNRFTRAETADDGGVVFRCVNCGAELRYYAVDTGEQPDISDTTDKTVDSVIIPDTTLVTEVSRETKPFDKPQITEPVTSIITDDISETEPVTAPIESLGDINGDGKVNSKDLTRLMKIIAGVSGESAENVDINGDGKVNSKDLTRLMKMIAGDTVA